MDEMDKILYIYNNGNTKVTILEDGTKIREYEGTPNPILPESIDCKITSYCDLNCPWCHEKSTQSGKHADLVKLLNVLEVLPSGVELAIGGGNPLSHPEIIPFLETLKARGIICNMTMNIRHLPTYGSLIRDLQSSKTIYGLGISLDFNGYISNLKVIEDKKNVVIHMIAGIHTPETINTLSSEGFKKILILGYKQVGRGEKYYTKAPIEENINIWYKELPKYFDNGIICFDNLAIEQLNVKRFFKPDGWDKFYMGDDFEFTMYIDAVKEEFAHSSCATARINYNTISLIDYFNQK